MQEVTFVETESKIEPKGKVIEDKPGEIPVDEVPSVQEESPSEERSTAKEPYYVRMNGYQALRGRGITSMPMESWWDLRP